MSGELNYESINCVIFTKMKLESNRRKRLNSNAGLEPEEHHLTFKCVRHSWILYWEVRNLDRSPEMPYQPAVDGIKMLGREVKIDDPGVSLPRLL